MGEGGTPKQLTMVGTNSVLEREQNTLEYLEKQHLVWVLEHVVA